MSRDIDNAFKAIIASGWANQTDGDVECPNTGFFAIIDMSTEREQITEILAEADLADAMDNIESSWYVTYENSQGFIYTHPVTEQEAHKWFKECQKSYFKWSEQ